jgi:hypothetical protein
MLESPSKKGWSEPLFKARALTNTEISAKAT